MPDSRRPQTLPLLVLVALLSKNTIYQRSFKSQHSSAAASLKQSAVVRLNSLSWFSLNPAQCLILLILMPRSLIWKGWSASHAGLHLNEAESSVNRGEHACGSMTAATRKLPQPNLLHSIQADDIIRQRIFMYVTAVNTAFTHLHLSELWQVIGLHGNRWNSVMML